VTVLSDTFDVNIEKKLVDRSISFVFGYEKDTLIGFLYLRNVGETIFAMEIVDMLKNEVNLSLEIADLVNETENLNVQATANNKGISSISVSSKISLGF